MVVSHKGVNNLGSFGVAKANSRQAPKQINVSVGPRNAQPTLHSREGTLDVSINDSALRYFKSGPQNPQLSYFSSFPSQLRYFELCYSPTVMLF